MCKSVLLTHISVCLCVGARVEYLDISIYGGNRVFFSDVARKLGKFVLDVVRRCGLASSGDRLCVDGTLIRSLPHLVAPTPTR